MEQRNKLWRRQKGFFKFKKRLMRLATSDVDTCVWDSKRRVVRRLHWFDLAKVHWTTGYRTTGTPCSCWLCRSEKYNRKAFRKETHDILNEYGL